MGHFDEIIKMKADYEAKLKTVGVDCVAQAYADYFQAHPQVKALRWEQYTPYFNDGEPCVFSVCDAYLHFGGDSDDSDEDDDDYDEDEDEGGFLSEYDVKPAQKPLFKELPDIPEDILLSIFGDHQRVTVTRADDPSQPPVIETDEYEHD